MARLTLTSRTTTIAVTLTVLLLAILISLHMLMSPALSTVVLNADAMYLPTLLRDLVIDGGQWHDWYLAPAPYLFPDLPIMVLAWALGGPVDQQILIYNLLFWLALLTAFAWLGHTAGSPRSTLSALLAVSVMLALATRTAPPYDYLLAPAHHQSIILIGALLLALWLSPSLAPGKKYGLMGVLAAATTLSDNLFLLQVALPLLAAAWFNACFTPRSARAWLAPLIPVVCSLAGLLLYAWIAPNDTRNATTAIGLSSLARNAEQITTILADMQRNAPVLLPGLLLWLVLGLANWWKHRTAPLSGLPFLFLFGLLSVAATISAQLLLTGIDLSDRYFLPLLFWPVLWLCLYLSFIAPPTLLLAGVLASLLYQGLGLMQLQRRGELAFRTYMDEARCIQQAADDAGLTHGVAGYWHAKSVESRIGTDIRIAQYTGNFDEMRWITSAGFYRPTYDFALVALAPALPYQLDAEAVTSRNGPPAVVKACGTVAFYGYGKGKISPYYLNQPGATRDWPGCSLPNHGQEGDNCTVLTPDSLAGGHLTFGPYVRLAAGNYRVQWQYASPAPASDTAATWDIIVPINDTPTPLAVGNFPGTDNNVGHVDSVITIDEAAQFQPIELRTSAMAGMPLRIDNLRLERLP